MIKITREQEIWKRKIILDRINMMNEEQSLRNKIQALSGIDNIYLDMICNTLKSYTTEKYSYLQLLNQVVTRLLDGWSIGYILHCLQGNKYTSYKGEENMMDYCVRAFNTEMLQIEKILACREKDIRIVDVNPIVPNKVVEVTFADGTKEKSVCREPDTFSLESAISICISKKIMGGSSAYNNAVKRGMKVYEDKQKKEVAEKAEQKRIEKKRAKRLAYKERRAVKKREEQIAIQTEAYLRAMKAMSDSKNVVVNEENN